MLKWTKKLRIMSMTIMPLSVLFLPISFVTNHNANEENKMLYYAGRLFKNEEEALAYLIQSGKVTTGQQKVFGDKARSFINAESGQLNKNFLPDYDISKMKFAWFNAGNGITKNYESARNSYFNPGTVVPRFSDGFTNQTFATEVAARNSINNHRLNTQLGFYDVDFIDDATGNLVKRKLNPFNLEDISEYKKNLANNIDKILEDNILNDSDARTLGYNIKINGDSEKTISNNVNFIFNKNTVTNWINEFVKSKAGKVNDNIMNYNNNILSLSEDNWYTKEFYSDRFYSGSMKYNSSKQFTVLENKLKYTIAESGHSFKWNANDLSDLNLFEIKKILRGPGDTHGMYKSINPEVDLEISKHENSFSKLLKNINLFFLNKIKSNEKGLSNAKILNSIAKKKAGNISINRYYDSLTYAINETGLPNFEARLHEYGFGLGFGSVKHEMWILRKYYSFNYGVNYKINLSPLFNFKIDASIKNVNLFNKLWALSENNKSKNITISKNGLDLFSGDVSLDQATGKFKFQEELKTTDSNYQGNLTKKNGKFNAVDLKALDLSKSDDQATYLEYLLIKFRDDLDAVANPNKNLLDQDGSKPSYQAVFDKYFKKAKGTEKGGGLYTVANTFTDGTEGKIAYYGDLRNGNINTYIDQIDIFKKYFAQINDAYSKYQEEYIFEQLSKGIISSQDTLFYDGDNSGLFRPTLAEYIINTISDFNPSLTKGIFASADSIATTISQRDSLSNQKVSPDLILIAYDNNGNAINAGDYKYDSADLLEYNSRLSITPKRDYDHIYVEGYNGPVSNQINNIYWATFDNHKLYFDKFYNLKTFMLKYIRENAEMV